MNLHIREAVLGPDDEVWVDIGNRARAEDPEFTSQTASDYRTWQKAPWFSPEGRFIAELDGKPVGAVSGHVDKERTEKQGFLRGPEVIPAARRRGVGTALALRAFESLRARGMEMVQGHAQGWNVAAQAFVKKFGFKQVRVFSTMEADLATIPHGVGESDTARLELTGRTEEDARLLVGLENDSFKEHFNHRDGTVAEAMFWFNNLKELEMEIDICIARVEDKPAGFVIYGIDHKDNRHQKKERGWLFSLGVLKSFRGQGLAKALMIYGMRELKAKGMKQAGLGVDDTNVTSAMRLYERLGFKTMRKHLTYERSLA